MSEPAIATDSDQSDHEVLLPISALFPPNQIISKKYAPDVKPTFRLVSSQKKEKRRATLNSEPRNEYWDAFGEEDTLGFDYASRLKNSLVYLKLNNQQYMRLSLKGSQTKYMGGLFIPLDRLLAEPLKKARHVYKILPGLNFVDYKWPVENSFGSNCLCEAPDVRFSSNYQSGNLLAAVRVGEGEYDLILQNDINSKGNTQWFNFTVELSEERIYKFNITNLTKSSSLYQKGMSVAVYSQGQRLHSKTGWTRGCHNITYTRTDVMREDSDSQYYYRLHFEYRNSFKSDTVTFAYCYPYTLLDLERFFNRVMFKKVVGSLKIDKMKIAETLTGFPINIYAISHRRNHSKKSLASFQQLEADSTPSLIFLARQHPGESQSSYIAEGIVEWLMESDYDGWKKNFHYYIVPMVNIDGVFYGNYRTNLSGNDLNRVWRHPRKDYHHEIYSLKKFFHSLNRVSPIALVLDIHGHSNSLNSFFYGNPPRKDSDNPKLFPYYCSRKLKQVSYTQSTFNISEDKKSCARVVLAQMFPKALVYTFENSFYGWRKGRQIVQHTVDSYRKLGKDLIQCYIEYTRLCDKNTEAKERWAREIEEIEKEPLKQAIEEAVPESDDEAEAELIEFAQIDQPDSALLKQSGRENLKQKTPSIGKTKFVKYLRRHSPAKLKSYFPTTNQTYLADRQSQPETQGFLSIIKINTRSNIESTPLLDSFKMADSRRSQPYWDSSKENHRDEVIQERESSEGYIKVGKLINQKEMAMEKLRMKRQKMEEGLAHSKTFNTFFRYPHTNK